MTTGAGMSPASATRWIVATGHTGAYGATPLSVVGASWLYNLEAYRRLFPTSYVMTAQPMHGRFQHMPLWGQFVKRCGRLSGPMAREFLKRLTRQSSLEGLDQRFPFQVLRVEAPVREFYAFYGVRG